MSYAYNADMYCDDCAEGIKSDCGEDTGDTDEYPQYDHSDESDCPWHCGDCGVFLENSLTADGYDYVQEAVNEGSDTARLEWGPYYNIKPKNSGHLDGLECPECEALGPFSIGLMTMVTDLTGPDNYSDPAYESESPCYCPQCDFRGIVEDFYNAS